MAASTCSLKRKKPPGKRCCVMFCNKTNAEEVSLHQFPKNDNLRQKWSNFVLQKRDTSTWTRGSGYICSDHFLPLDYDGFNRKQAGFATKLILRKDAVPTVNPVPTPHQLSEAKTLAKRFKTQKKEVPKVKDVVQVVPKHAHGRSSSTLIKLHAHRVNLSQLLYFVLLTLDCMHKYCFG